MFARHLYPVHCPRLWYPSLLTYWYGERFHGYRAEVFRVTFAPSARQRIAAISRCAL